jgi:hypothetical protein
MLTRCKIKGEKFEERLHGIKMTVFPPTAWHKNDGVSADCMA